MFVLLLSSSVCKSHEVEMAEGDRRKGRPCFTQLTGFIYFPEGYLHDAKCLFWWAVFSVWIIQFYKLLIMKFCLGGLLQLSDYHPPSLKMQEAFIHSVIQYRHLLWLGILLDTGNADLKMTRSLLEGVPWEDRVKEQSTHFGAICFDECRTS